MRPHGLPFVGYPLSCEFPHAFPYRLLPATSWCTPGIILPRQEPILFATSIADNIAYGSEHATREEVIVSWEMAFVLRWTASGRRFSVAWSNDPGWVTGAHGMFVVRATLASLTVTLTVLVFVSLA